MKDQRKLGVIISYITMIANTFLGVFFTPFLISSLGTAEYGLYQLVHSFAGYLVILNFGTGAVISRYVALYRYNKDTKSQQNFLAHAFLITTTLAILTLLVSSILYFGIDGLFKGSLSLAELVKAKQLYVLMVLNIAFSFYGNAYSGVLTGYEKFAVTNSFKLLRIILRIAILVILLLLGYKSVVIVLTDLAITIFMILLESFYSHRILRAKIRFYHYDKPLLWMVFSFSSAIFLQAIVNQINQNVDRVVLGAMTNTEIVALYSVALVFFTVFNNIAGTIGSVFLPQATKMVSRNATGEELTDFVIRPGRIQFMLAGAAITGFILFGQNFIKIWVGSKFLGAYILTILLIVPVTFPLIQNVAVAILDAMLKRLTRSIIKVIIAVLNIVISVILVNFFGYIGAAIGTAAAVIIGDVILMNIYYKKVIGLNVFRMFKQIFGNTIYCLVASAVISLPLTLYLSDSFINFLIKGAFFMTIYLLLLYRFSMTSSEKQLLLKPIKKIFLR